MICAFLRPLIFRPSPPINFHGAVPSVSKYSTKSAKKEYLFSIKVYLFPTFRTPKLKRQVYAPGLEVDSTQIFKSAKTVEIVNADGQFGLGRSKFFKVAVAPGDGACVDSCFVTGKNIQFGIADHHTFFRNHS